VLPLAAAVGRHPDADLVLYNRCSSWGQAGRGKAELAAKTRAVYRAVRAAAPDRPLRAIVSGVEEGRVLDPANPRRHLRDAAGRAAGFAARTGRPVILVAADLSRFIRAAAYHRVTNPEAGPTAAEFARLRELTGGVPLATVADPGMTERERQSAATRRTGRAGRPRRIDDEMAAWIFGTLGPYWLCPERGWIWSYPIDDLVAEARDEFPDRWDRVTRRAIHRAAGLTSPDGRTWRERAMEAAVRMGLMRRRPGGGYEAIPLDALEAYGRAVRGGRPFGAATRPFRPKGW
jgi:hypothetical protein